jgi:HAD superfamily hydrolase (TIGR01509 family)
VSEFELPQSPLRAVAFDLDGLLFDTERLYEQVGTEVLARRGKTVPNDLFDQMMGRKAEVALQLMIDACELASTVNELARESAEVMFKLLATELATMPGALELLAALEAANIPKAVVTSSPRTFVDRVLGEFDLAKRFSFVLASEDVEEGKPAPDVYLMAAKRLGVAPAEMLVLEDSQNGCRAGVAAGAYVVAVPNSRTHAHAFDGVRFVATSLEDPRIFQVLGLTGAS